MDRGREAAAGSRTEEGTLPGAATPKPLPAQQEEAR